MQISNGKIIQDLQLTLTGDSYVSFYEDDADLEDSWGVWPTKINHFPKNTDDCKEISLESFLKVVKGKDLQAEYFNEGNLPGIKFPNDMKHIIDFFGIAEMKVLGAKVPSIISSRFTYFASLGDKTPSEVLRELIYGYVKQEMESRAGTLMFRREQDYLAK